MTKLTMPEIHETSPPLMHYSQAAAILERQGYEVRCIAAGSDGQRMWAVHRPDPTTAKYYNPRSYFDAEGLIALASITTKQGLRDAIVAAQRTSTRSSKYLLLREDESMKTKTNKTNAAKEKAARDARAAKATKTAPAKVANKKASGKAPAAKATKKAASKNGNGKATVESNDPDVKFLAGFQEQTMTERMNGNNMVQLFKRIKAATYDNPVANSGLNLYDKRQARELARLEIVAKDKIEGLGLCYFAK